MKIRSLLLVYALALYGCAPAPATVKNKTAHYEAPATTNGQLAAAGEEIVAGQKIQQRAPLEAIGKYLSAADAALTRLRTQPHDAAALNDYDFALSRVFSAIASGHVDAWSRPLTVPGYVVTHRKDPRTLWNPSDYDFTPCDELTVGGSDFRERARRAGLGATLLATRRTSVTDFTKRFLPSSHFYYGITAVASFQGNRCEITLEDPLAKDTVNVAGQTFPLAGDFSTPVAMFLLHDKERKLGFARLIHPDEYKDTTLLFHLQPYDPKKIPVLFVHGLQDTSATWMDMLNALLDDPVIRDNYQFWFFTYPSGYPYPYCASLLRHDLDLFDKALPDHKPIVIVGHSMGGLLTRMMLTDSSHDEMWRYFFNELPAKTPLSAEDRALFENLIIFKERRDISRAIFLSTPHRGSVLATNWIGKIGTKLVHLPANLVKLGTDVSVAESESKAKVHLSRMPNSIDTLAPTNPFVIAMNKRPLAPGIPYHQIIGDRGKGNSPHSSDGIVDYWSSHLDGAQSTLVVPSGHMTNRNAEGIEEVRRILKQHVKHGT